MNMEKGEKANSKRKELTHKILECFGWIILGWCLPLILWIVPFVVRIKKLKKNHPERNRGYMWVAFALNMTKIVIFILLIAIFALVGASTGPEISPIEVSTEYGSADGLYRLTGVHFPEVEPVDSLFYSEGLPSNNFYEHKYVIKKGTRSRLHRELEKACVRDSTHWSKDDFSWMLSETTGSRGGDGSGFYSYLIYPDQLPVDRSRGDCDRMFDDGTKDWDGTFISVEVQRDTVWIREGWLR